MFSIHKSLILTSLCLSLFYLQTGVRLAGEASFSAAESKAAEQGRQALESSSDAISVCDLERYVKRLASPEYEGRGTGGRGERMATAYLAEFFNGLGLEPAGEKGSYFQSFQVAQGKEKDGENYVHFGISGPLGMERKLEAGQDLEPLSFSPSGEVKSSPAVFTGFGIKTKDYDSFKGIDAKGKWLVLLRGSPKDKKALKRFAPLAAKAKDAKKLGAVGILFVKASNPDVGPEVVTPAINVGGGNNLLPAFTISDKLAATLLAGNPKSSAFQELYKAHYEDGEIRSFPLPYTIQARIGLKTRYLQARNVLARLPAGEKPGAESVMVGGHIDHLGFGDKGGTRAQGEDMTKIHPGADDNASGISALMELAQYYAGQKAAGTLQLQRDLVFAGWSGEEMGLHGSKYYVKKATNGEEENLSLAPHVSAYLNLDMVGRLGDNPLRVQATGSSSTWQTLLDGIQTDLKIQRLANPFLPTDSTSFYNAGVPALALFTGTHDEYHTPADTADKIDFAGLHKVTTYVQHLTHAVANLETAPKYAKFERSRPKVKIGVRMEDAGEEKGVKVLEVMAGSPAQKAGVQPEDVLESLDKKPIKNMESLLTVLAKCKAGKEYPMKVRRGKASKDLKIVPAKR